MKAPYRPFWHWIFRQPSEFAAIAFGLVFAWLSPFAGDHCVSQFSMIAAAFGGTGYSYYIAFPLGILETAICIGAYGGFAVMLAWCAIVSRSAKFAAIYGAQLLVLGSVWAVDRCILWLSTWPNVNSSILIALNGRTLVHINENLDWINDLAPLPAYITAALMIQYLFARLGWGILRPRFRFRASLFVRSWAYTSLASGPVLFCFYFLMGGISVFLGRLRADELMGLWLIAWAMYSLLMPTAVAIRLVRRRAGKLWPRCSRCRYPLVGNISGRCPECGTTCEVPA